MTPFVQCDAVVGDKGVKDGSHGLQRPGRRQDMRVQPAADMEVSMPLPNVTNATPTACSSSRSSTRCARRRSRRHQQEVERSALGIAHKRIHRRLRPPTNARRMHATAIVETPGGGRHPCAREEPLCAAQAGRRARMTPLAARSARQMMVFRFGIFCCVGTPRRQQLSGNMKVPKCGHASRRRCLLK